MFSRLPVVKKSQSLEDFVFRLELPELDDKAGRYPFDAIEVPRILFDLVPRVWYTEHQPNLDENQYTELDQSTKVWHFSTLC